MSLVDEMQKEEHTDRARGKRARWETGEKPTFKRKKVGQDPGEAPGWGNLTCVS